MKTASHTSVPLTTGWTLKQGDRSSTHPWFPAHDAPTEVYRDLLKNGVIADPFQDLNELSVRWVGDETWTYRTSFGTPGEYTASGNDVATQLRFSGLDTFASVYLNGNLVLESSTMFVEHRVDVTGKLNEDEQHDNANSLEIVFHSARKKGLELVKEQQTQHRYIVHQTEISRGPVRKAQYHWGWDWGPILMTCGPWKPISIETWSCRLADLHVEYVLSRDLKSAGIKITVQWEGSVDKVTFRLTRKERVGVKKTVTVAVSNNPGERHGSVQAEISMEAIALWWPRGYGAQNLYIVQAEAYAPSDGSSASPVPLHCISQHVGFRRAELIQEPDSHGTSFYFRINDTDIFCGGACWIPADSLLTRLTPADYHAWMQLAAAGNQTMLRVWGGGIYEADEFYDATDELGILVWQDFMFACANYPAHAEYLASVEAEARQNVRRLRNHASIVLWAGNNEDYQIVERYGLEYDAANKDADSWLRTNFPARYIYEHLLPNIVAQESPGVAYHPSSPFGNGTSTVLKVDPTIGDIHQWNVWHGAMSPYQELPSLGGRFVSEFGMEAYPHVSTLEGCITASESLYPGSMAMDFRNKAIGHGRRLASYVAENFRVREDVRGFAHLTHVMQADAMAWAYGSWRRDWGTRGARKCGGVLVWQLNDCWPTMSWAVVDYERVPKPAFYAIKRAMQSVAVGVRRSIHSWTMRPADELWQRDTGHIDMRKVWRDVEFDVWIANSTLEEMEGSVDISYISIKTGVKVGQEPRRSVRIAANGTTEVLKNHAVDADWSQPSDEPFDVAKADPFVIQVALHVAGRCIAKDISWPEPIKYLSFVERGVKVEYSEDMGTAFVSAAKPVKGFVFGERKGVRLSDNGFDVMPGETHKVHVDGCAADELEWRYIDM